MATLNGVEFGIVHITKTVVHDNNIKDIPGSDTVVHDDLGYSTAPMRITGHVKNDNEYDDLKEQYYSGGELTLIVDLDSGRQYTVYAHQNLTDLDGDRTYPLTDIVFQAMFFMKNPYLESITDKTQTKSITSNNQEWTADNDGSPLKTDGNVDAVPDIKVTGNLGGVSTYKSLTVEATQLSLGHTNTKIGLRHTFSGQIINSVTFKLYKYGSPTGTLYVKVYNDSDVLIATSDTTLDVSTLTGSGTEKTFTFTSPVYLDLSHRIVAEYSNGNAGNHVKFRTASSDVDATVYATTYDGSNWSNWSNDPYAILEGPLVVKDPQIYNTADSTVKCDVANDMLIGAIHRINVDGTGTVKYSDNFTSAKYIADSTYLNITHDTGNDELDIADDGYIYWKMDTKFPINGIPTLTAGINITSGAPTIQISEDAATWYDIDTAIVTYVETVYPLDSSGNLSLAGKTVFYWRFDCVKAAPATASIKSFELDINTHTIYAKNPVITKGATASTFRCDQDADSGMACDVTLFYPDRWWA